MKATLLKKIFFLSFISSIGISLSATIPFQYRKKHVGLFTRKDPRIEDIRFGNWGSRPYEYAWASEIVNIKGKKVIDLGTGIPSQYNWYEYVMRELQPSFYAGIDHDDRIISEQLQGQNFEIRYMDMADLQYPDKSFDIAYCISTFEHVPYEIFMKSIAEAHRVLKDDGLLVITLDEEWDKDVPFCHENSWNLLELDLVKKGFFKNKKRTFGLPEFLTLIKDHFELLQEDAIIDTHTGRIISDIDNFEYYHRKNRDNTILNSGLPINSCVSYAVLKKKN